MFKVNLGFSDYGFEKISALCSFSIDNETDIYNKTCFISPSHCGINQGLVTLWDQVAELSLEDGPGNAGHGVVGLKQKLNI